MRSTLAELLSMGLISVRFVLRFSRSIGPEEMERERVTKEVQQSQQGRWTTWEDVVKRSISWNDIWRTSPYRLAFVVRSIYDQLPSKDNLRIWGLTEGCKAANVSSVNVANPGHSIMCSQIANVPLIMVGTHGDTKRS